jgi:succinoglycan biosynthesis transport protein ExoP
MQVIKNLDLAHKVDFAGKKLVARIHSSDPIYMAPKDREELLKTFESNEKVEVLPKTRIIEIRYRSVDPKLATDTVNGILDSYLQRNFQSKYEGSMQVSNWLSKQMEELKTNAFRAQQRLADFQKQHDILGTDENNNIVTDRLRHLNQQLADAEADRILKEARYRLASSGNPELVAAVVPSTTLQVLRTQQAELKAQYAQLDSKFGSNYPKLVELQVQLKGLDQNINEELRNVGQRLREEFQAANDSETMLRQQFETQKQEAFKLNENAVQFETLKHEVETSQELSDTLQLKLKEAGLMAGLASADISIVDRGLVPSRPVFPKKILMLPLGLIVGLFGGVVVAFVLESVDDTLETSEEIESISALPALATIPLMKSRHFFDGNVKGSNQRLPRTGLGTIAVRYRGTLLAEAYQVVCNSVLLAAPEHPPRVLLVTSAVPGEGKSTTSCNLAISLAQRGGRVLLVDADLRRSTLNSLLALDSKPTAGLSSVLAGACESEAVSKPVPEVPNLEMISAGPRTPCPSQLLGSNKMNELLERWSTEYDHVVIDTAPVLFVADSVPLAAKADAVLLVVRSGRSTKKAFTRVRDLLHRANAHVVGVILNGVDIRLEQYSYSSRYGSYGDAYGDRDEAN